MTLYRIRFELCSAIVTPLKGDTIWGHIAWGIANHEGDEAVADFLEQEKSDPPGLVVSSAFPAGMVCRPLPPPQDRDGSLDIGKYSEIKKNKKIKYASASEYFAETEAPIKKTEGSQNPFRSVQVMHNTIDRSTNTVLEREGGLYATEELWPATSEWDMYILSSFTPDRVKQLVAWAFENGYGADASTGKGNITNIGDPVAVTPKKQGNTYMALGPFVDSQNGISNIRADIFVRQGKLGGAFASGFSPWKKPVVLYDEGAVLEYAGNIGYAGKLLEKMHNTDEFNICQSGFAPVIPI